ncbi:hypothetical protein BTK66_13675 [Cronobacter sakazakii]|uniref:Uncharacterized protein n=1 Tax=Cronobacter sakazakii TaxID=28141 RepID=A0AA45C2W8_CROSK|nr:hypothetical protein FZI10_11530 [Cronobacter sakazakii]KAB0864090.1 hypothetical protein FZH98_18860 [Cronobacter sakazakii]KAB1061846.1 hypothetical protein AUN10_08085 [Cronobacter sakazakii]MCI0323015.1 hypothetical protein [Cronobacter sakazakii]PUE78906.1 hypothetical protein C3D71_05180 [Cronobacter sakazakii]
MICVSATSYRYCKENGHSDIYGYIVKKCHNFKKEANKGIFIKLNYIYQQVRIIINIFFTT